MKKRLVCLVLTLCVLLGLICLPVSAEEGDGGTDALAELIEAMNGADANDDGSYTTADTKLILAVVAGVAEYPEEKSFDLNRDGYTDLLDVEFSLKLAAKTVNFGTELLDVANTKLNAVKTELPGFTYDNTVHCKSCLVTTSLDNLSFAEKLLLGDYLDKLVVTDKPLYDYFKGMESVIPDEDKANYQKQLKDAKELTEPQRSNAYVGEGKSYSHRIFFPVKNQPTASTLTSSDVSSVGLYEDDEVNAYIIKIKLGTKSYTSSKTFLSALENGTLSYAKAFNNVPNESAIGDSTLKKLSIKNGIINVYVDKETGALLTVDYSFDYEINLSKTEVSQVNNKNVNFTMLTKQKVYITEHYDIARNTLEVVE